ncbi:hypothetical protein BDK92_1156 [Micromonospora pisi]|uniref:Ig-like domain-containing protein n=1 Tax=Micromonospora pisi TaxID=589240 RepID=A0A495JD94_9ACTN|nr:hypothetical protein [Micromonospora pisi]RKR86887.1 hypothetical protein BDK92_1156 [Micromonospora pisi]
MNGIAAVLLTVGALLGGGLAEPARLAEDTACITTPTTPSRDPGGFRIFTTASNGCAAPTTLWLVRHEADGSAWHSSTEIVLMPGASGRLDWPCRSTGTGTYSAIQFDPNMAFNKSTPQVLITC